MMTTTTRATKESTAIASITRTRRRGEPRHEWQTKSFPTCNFFHEQDTKTLLSTAATRSTKKQRKPKQQHPRARASYVAGGAFRDVWRLFPDSSSSEQEESVAPKTLVHRLRFDEMQYDRHRRRERTIDVVAVRRTHLLRRVRKLGSRRIRRTLEDILRRTESNGTEKLVLGYHAAAAVSDVHSTDSSSRASISHTDAKPKQYVYSPGEGVMKLTDFNRCRFIERNKDSDEMCPFEIGNNGGRYRSPEEYRYAPETEKIDVGNVLYTILTGRWPFEDISTRETRKRVPEGGLPRVSGKIRRSADRAETALPRATKMSWVHDPAKRPSSTTVKDYLYAELQKLGLDDRIFFST